MCSLAASSPHLTCADVMMAMVRVIRETKLSSFSGASTLKPQSKTTMVFAPWATASAIGTFSTSPPSTNRRPSRSTSGKTPGIAALASRAGINSPSLIGTASAVSKSVVIAVCGTRNCEKSRAETACSRKFCRPSLETTVLFPAARATADFSTPPKMCSRVTFAHRWVNRSGASSGFSARVAPLSEPTEVPTTRSGRKSESAKARSIPT